MSTPNKTRMSPEPSRVTASVEPVEGHWYQLDSGDRVLELCVIEDSELQGGIMGRLSVTGPQAGQINILNIQVDPPENRGRGLGKRLMQAFAVEAKRAGARSLVGDIISAQQIHNRLQTFGEDNVTFYETLLATDYEEGTECSIPLSREQAVGSLRRAQQMNAKASVSAKTNLEAVDMTDWDVPTVSDYTKE